MGDTLKFLRDIKYPKAKKGYNEYESTSSSNAKEKQNLEKAKSYLQAFYGPEAIVIEAGDCFLNYLGVDFIIKEKNGNTITVDLKVCDGDCYDYFVKIDAYKTSDNWKSSFPAMDNKINDKFLFINKNKVILVSRTEIEKIPLPPEEDTEFMKVDKYKTTKKAVINIEKCRKNILSEEKEFSTFGNFLK